MEKKELQTEYYGLHKEWMLTKDKLYLKGEEDDGKKKWNYVSNYIKVINIRQLSESNDSTLTLEYYYKGAYKTVNILRDQIQSKELEKLSRKGIDAFHNNSKAMASFLRIQEETAPYETVHSSVGWTQIEEELYFKHHELIGGNLPDSRYMGEYDIQPKGSLQGWMDLMNTEVVGNQHLELALTLGFTAPIVGLLAKVKDMDSLVVHLYGNSTTGKTTAAQLAVSPFGKPSKSRKGLIKSWSATYNAAVAVLRDNYGIPVVLDESSMTKIADFTPLLYMFAENREKERLDKEGNLKDRKSWSTTIISTGEHSLFQKTNNNAGLRMRNFEFGNIIWTSSAENSNNLKEGLLDNYGHAGIVFVQYLLTVGIDEIVENCERWKTYCEEHLPQTEFVSRVSEKFGIILATAEMVKMCFNLTLSLDNMMQILHDVEEEADTERNITDKAYEYVCERIMQHGKYFITESQEFRGNECWGQITFKGDDVEVSIFPNKFNQLLQEGNFSDPKVVCKEWKEKGYLKAESGKNTNRGKIPIDDEVRASSGIDTTPDSKGRDKVYVVVLNREIAAKYGISKLSTLEEIQSTKRKKNTSF